MPYLITNYYNIKILEYNRVYYENYTNCGYYHHKKTNKFKFICNSNNKKLIKFLIENKLDNQFTNIKRLKYAHKHGCPWNIPLTCERIVEVNNLKCLKYAHKNNCLWNESTCEAAALNNSFKCLKYAHENNCRWCENTCKNAAYKNNLKCLEYAHKNNCLYDKAQLLRVYSTYEVGGLEIGKYIKEKM